MVATASVALAAGCSSPPTLRSGDVEDQIASGLAEQVGGDFSVTCPTGIAAQTGTSFTCSVRDPSDGSTVTVTVTQKDDAGGFDWRVEMATAAATPAASPT